MDKLKIKKLELHAGSGIRLGTNQNERTRFTNSEGATTHAAMLNERWAVVWADDDEDATLVESHLIRSVTVSKADALAALGAQTPPANAPVPKLAAVRAPRDSAS